MRLTPLALIGVYLSITRGKAHCILIKVTHKALIPTILGLQTIISKNYLFNIRILSQVDPQTKKPPFGSYVMATTKIDTNDFNAGDIVVSSLSRRSTSLSIASIYIVSNVKEVNQAV
ncbi:MAG: hypothetical protein ACI9Y1_003322 [Lentisphaeria bacterium]|jgi:hypothetical protein